MQWRPQQQQAKARLEGGGVGDEPPQGECT